MPLAEAKGMADSDARGTFQSTASGTVEFREWNPEDDRRCLQELAETVRPFAPIIGLDTTAVPDSLLMDVTGCGPLFGGESSLAEQLLLRMKQQKLECRIAISDSVAAAWAFAHPFGHYLTDVSCRSSVTGRQKDRPSNHTDWNVPVIVIPPTQCQQWLANLPVEAARIPPADIDLLRQLGLRRIQQLLQLPLADLPARLSEHAVQRIAAIADNDDEVIESIPEPRPIQAQWTGEFPTTNTDEVLQVLEFLMVDIGRQLQLRLLAARQLTCELKHETGGSSELSVEVLKPTQSMEPFTELLSLKLERSEICLNITAVTIRAITGPLPIPRQRDLFSHEQQTEPAEELAALVSRLQAKLGHDCILTPQVTSSPVPEDSVRLTPFLDKRLMTDRDIERQLSQLVTPDAEDLHPQLPRHRPLRLLAEPYRLDVAWSHPEWQRFCWKGRTYSVTHVQGPERIQSQWWQEPSVHRDYYRVGTDNGATFWLYQDLTDQTWYLHGAFD